MKTCFLFPGQGAQYPGMARDLWDASQKVKEMFQSASDAAGLDMKKLLFDSTAEDLKATDKTQVAMTLANLCSGHYLREHGIEPRGCAGFSLGEYAALCEAGVLEFKDVFPIVKIRGELMEKASRKNDSAEGPAGMAAVLGITAERVAAVVEKLADQGAYLSNYNSPGQVVVSGTARGLAEAETELKAAGARRFIRLAVSGPFHSPLLADAKEGLDKALSSFAFNDPTIPVYSNVTGARITTGSEARELCGRQIVSMVRWVTVEESLLADGFDAFFEAGPGTVLAGLFKALRPDVRCAAAGTVDGVNKAMEARA